MSDNLLEMSGVHTHIGAYHILHGVDLAVPRGQLTMLLGRNGAGKTTTLRTIMGLWQASQGVVRFNGTDITRLSTPHTLVVVDCLTLWLTQWTMPLGFETMNSQQKQAQALEWHAQAAMFLEAIRQSPGPVVLVGNEIGLGVIPMGREVRAFVDALGTLNQQVAQVCPRVTLMAAGLPLKLK